MQKIRKTNKTKNHSNIQVAELSVLGFDPCVRGRRKALDRAACHDVAWWCRGFIVEKREERRERKKVSVWWWEGMRWEKSLSVWWCWGCVINSVSAWREERRSRTNRSWRSGEGVCVRKKKKVMGYTLCRLTGSDFQSVPHFLLWVCGLICLAHLSLPSLTLILTLKFILIILSWNYAPPKSFASVGNEP